MAAFGNGPVAPSNNLWVGNNYAAPGYFQGARHPLSGITNPMGQMPQMTGQFQPQTVNNVLQVMGVESAREYQVGPNSQVILMDSNRPVFYMKRSDDSGYSEIKAFEFTEIPLDGDPKEVPAIDLSGYVSKDEFEDLRNQVGNTDYVRKSDLEEFKKTIEELVLSNG